MKVVIVFHSVCGNTYLMAKAFAKGFSALGHETGLYRVADPDWVLKPDISDRATAVLKEMQALPAVSADILTGADLIILGSPTYFGNVTAEMKTFMDSTGGLWFHGKLTGKRCAAFASAGNAEGGGDLCLQAIHTYGKYMGMATFPVPVGLVAGESWPALGIIQYSGGKCAEMLDLKTERAIEKYCAFLSRVV